MQLSVAEPGNIRRPYNISSPTVTLGRDSNNTIQINDPKASRNHCIMMQNGDAVMIKDLQSRNGTYVNGSKISSGNFYTFQPNSNIRIGDTIITLGTGSSVVTVVGPNAPYYRSGGAYPSGYRSSVPSVNVDLNLGPRGGLGNEMEYSYHASKSYVGPAVLATCLYYFGFFIVGLIVNILFLNSAKLTRSIIQRDPPGYVFLQIILWVHLALIVIGVIIIFAVGGFAFI